MFNSEKLSLELTAAGVVFSGCDDSGRVLDLHNNEIQDQPEVQAVLSKHDPAPLVDSDLILLDQYAAKGIVTDNMILALWKKIMQNDSTKADELQGKIDLVDSA